MAGYQSFQPTIGPGFLKGPYGNAWEAAFGIVKDYFSDLTKQGIQQRFILQAQAPALGLIGSERGIPQGTSESLASFVQALLSAWQAWQLAGSPWAILAELNFLGYTTAYVLTQNGALYGPSSGVALPNPNAGVVGNSPAFSNFGHSWTFATGFQSQPAGQQGYPYPLSTWEPSTAFGTNVTISPNPENGLLYFSAASGTTGSSAPAWPKVVGATVADGSYTWTCLGGAAVSPIGQGSGMVSYNFWSMYLIILNGVPGTWTNIVNPPTSSSAPSVYEIQAIEQLLTSFGSGHATCAGLLVIPQPSAIRPTFGFPGSRTFFGDVGMSAASVGTPPTTSFWVPHATYPTGGQIVPTSPNGFYYRTIIGGTAGYTQPVWPTTPGNTVVDGTITWTNEGATNTYQTGVIVSGQGATVFAFIPTSPVL